MLVDSAYGKSKVRLVQVQRRGDRHDIRDLTVAIQFKGDYDASYTAGDNTGVLPTDTMKNTVYALAARHPVREPEEFGLVLARHFIERNPRLRRVRIELTEHGSRSARASTDRRSSATVQKPARQRSGSTIVRGRLQALESSISSF
jgi:urate oxidase